jgi:DNA-directed RNA polymerase subunit RPC12/RpoP
MAQRLKEITIKYQCPECGKLYTVNYSDSIQQPETEFRQGVRLLVCPECSTDATAENVPFAGEE